MSDKISDVFLVLSNQRFKIIFLLLLRSQRMVSSNELARTLRVTSRTIKSDIKSMRSELAGFGIEIVAKSSEGYKLMMKDQEQSRQLKEYFQIYQPNTVNDELKIRIQYIIRRLLSAKEPIKTEQLQKELFLNENNSLHKEFAEVKTFFRLYHIRLIVKPHHGITIEGELFYKISCIVRMYRYFYKNSPVDLGAEDFNDLFICDEDEKTGLRKILHKTLAGSEIVFSDIYCERFLMYLIFFRNCLLREQDISIEFPDLCFQYRMTKEAVVVEELVQKLRNRYQGFDFDKDIIKYLSLAAIMSTDLYRFRDCSSERYGGLTGTAEDLRNFILAELSAYYCINMFDDYTCFKDLLKMMIPVSLKQLLQLSDDVDLGFHDLESMSRKPIYYHSITCLCQAVERRYSYTFSMREQYMLFTIIQGLFNRITLSHTKLKLALIAIDGRLATQQLKFNLQHYFSEFIEKIETKMLYELESTDTLDYDYYLCMEYGKHMNIEYSPVYYASEDLSEKEYVKSLNQVFLNSYRYQKILPPVNYIKIKEKYRFEPFRAIHHNHSSYHDIMLGKGCDIRLFINFNSPNEQVNIYYFEDLDHVTLYGEKYFIVVDTQIADNSQKLKMIINVLDRILENPSRLRKQCENNRELHHILLVTNNIN